MSDTRPPASSAPAREGLPPWLRAWEDTNASPLLTMPNGPAPARPEREGLAPGVLGAWWQAGLRAAALRAPGPLAALQATPLVAGVLALVNVLCLVLWQRLLVAGPADFHWRPLTLGWLDMAVLVWVCAWVRPAAGTLRLVCLALAAGFVLQNLTGLLWVGATHGQLWRHLGPAAQAGWWVLYVGPMLWWLLAVAAALWREGDRQPRPFALAVLLLAAAQAAPVAAPLPPVWTKAAANDEAGDERPTLTLDEAVLEAQASLLDRQLAALKPQRPGVVDMYVLTFAPYGEEDVFRRESAMVAEVTARRFDAEGRVLQLVNHAATAQQLPWATTANLRRALQGVARVMDPREDVLFIHLTSHGARQGQLAAELWPLQVGSLTPALLKEGLGQAGIRHRVISISACFSGSWIPTLAGDGTLVMTAADDSHTSYGCGRLSPLTFFGRAMYDELLRNETHSFTEAHAKARELIRQREQEAGKDDGYSNPQIRQGAAIAPVLEALRRRLEALPAPRPPLTPASAAR